MRHLAGILFVLWGFVFTAAGQPLMKSAIQMDPGNTKQTGATFGYRLTYNCSSTSGPCLNAEVVDLLPPEVQYVSTVPASPTGDVAAINVTPNYGGSGRTRVQFVMIDPLPAGNSGDLLINVRFPNGSTPDGTQATNTADGINLGASPGTTTTAPVTVTAVANVQVNLQKTLLSAPANLDMPESYRLRIGVPNANGALSLTSIGPVVDTLPAGTIFNGATPAADCQPGCVGTTPATVTWTSPCFTPLNPNQNCDITVNVTFPSATFPSGASVTNRFSADATPNGEPPQTFGPGEITHPVTTFVPAPGAGLTKNLTGASPNPPTLNQTFSYDLDLTNNGNVPLDNLVVVDTLPVELQVISVSTGSYSALANFAAGEGVRVSYEKNTAPGVFTLWGSSPASTTNTTLTAPPPGLGAGEYITRIRWEYGQAAPGMGASTRPLITSRIINPDNAGGPTSIGETINNCAALSAVYTAGPTNVNRTDCESFAVSGPFVQFNPAKDNLSGGGPFNPGQTVSWRLRVRSDARSSDPIALADVVVADLLPADLTFTSWSFDAQGTGRPAPQNFTQIPNYAGTGRTLLRWEWNAGSGNLGVNQQVWINISTTIRNGATSGPLSNDVVLDSDSPALAQRCTGSSQADALDLDGDGDTVETLCRATGSITVAGIAQLVASKTIRGTCDGGAVATSAGTLAGGAIEYHLRVQNTGTVPMQNLVLIDILPFIGDTGVRDTNPRGSQWTPLLAAPIVPPSGTTLYYSTSGNPCRGEVGGPTTGCDAPNWTTVAPAPITSVRSFRLDFGDRVVAPSDFVEFTFVMTVPGDVPAAAVAYNSFAYQADRADGLGALAAEPQKVGISLGSCDAASLGDFVWVDTNGDGIQNDGPTGVNGVVVRLFTPGADGTPGTIDDVPLASTITSHAPGGAAGWYSFPGLAPGSYFVTIERPPAFAIAPRDATADANDSDASAEGVSHVVTLAANENDATVDFGLVATAFGAAGDYVWLDRDGDGVQNEPVTSGLNGVTVRLWLDDGDGTREPGSGDHLAATTVTADDAFGRPGYYLFEELVAGMPYFLEFATPAAATGETTSHAGGDDSDADANGLTPVFTVAALETNRAFDAGYLAPAGTLSLGDQVWRDTDDDGVFEPENGETGIDGVRLDLYRDVNGDGEPTLDEFAGAAITATTGGFAGRYAFDDLAPGTWIVVVAPSNFHGGGALAGHGSSTGNDPAPDPDDDVNDDDNGAQAGALVASRPVTLTDNGEPTFEDGNNDSNLTVDFGFVGGGDVPGYDYGDAPDVAAGSATGDYRTTALDSGARHALGGAGSPYLGPCVDSDGGFAQNVTATGDDVAAGLSSGCGPDDEDGVTFSGAFVAGGTASFSLTAGSATPCLVDAWVDWNQNGVFGDAGEQIAASVAVAAGPAVVLTPAVPANALAGFTYARFRCSSGGGLAPAGAASDGEVEDYRVAVAGTDFGDAPASYGAASHIVDPAATLFLGTCVDMESSAPSTAGATGDDDNAGTSAIGSCANDEDGVAFTTPLVACNSASVTVTANAAGLLDAWIDFNADGSFGAGEQVFTGQPLTAGANALSIAVPCGAVAGATHARFRISSAGGLTPTGAAADGEVEDYAVAIAGSDFGDAPDSYATLFASNGPRHVVVSGFSLGAMVDADADGQPTAGASGDGADEDGAIASEGFACGGLTYNVTLTNSAGIAAPRLDAWIDFDGDGAFNEPRDRIHTAVPLVAGSNMVHATIPCDVVTRSTYARFRLSDGGVASASGAGGVGEVEDYAFALHGLDYGDAPAPHPTLRADEGARHVVLLSGNPILGSSVDEESDGQPNGTATGDDANGIDDEDGVTVPAALVAATTGSITVTAGATGGNVSCWIDFNADGDWTDAGERIVTDLALAANASASPAFAVPADAARGTAFLRCRISTFTGLGPAFLALNGEVEDHAVTITAYDFGDAPDPLYPTLLASNGARHQLAAANNPTLGPTVDADADGQPSAAFDGDDATFTDDENGVTFPGVLLPSTNGTLTLTAGATGGIVRCWIDFNRDGDWNDDGEQVVNDLTIGANASASPSFAVPAGASNGVAAVRCRMSTLGGLTPAGDAPDGEVEDHAAIIGSVDLGDAPASYRTTLANDGPRHGVVSGFSLGATIDAESDGQPSAAADGDGADEDGVAIPPVLTACSTPNLTVVLTNTAAVATPNLDAWIDFDADGIFEPAERIIDSVLVAGTNDIPINVPCSVPTATTYARLRLSSIGVNTPLGAAVDGEVEDFVLALQGLDFGDASDPSFPTLLASDGARHVVLAANNPTLGTSADTEPNGAASAGATGDDTAGVDDEDGVTFGPLIAGTPASVTIGTGATGGIVNLWIDLDQDGDWSDAGEHVVVEQTLGAHVSQPYGFLVPVSAVPGAMTARARISSQAGLGVTGLASDGEVEDHVAVILGAEPRIEVTMDLVSSTFAGPCGSYDVVFDVTLQNLGNVTLTNVQAETPLASVFIAPATYAITSITSGELAVDPSYDGASQPRLLLPGATLAPGQSATIRVALRLDATCQNVTYQVITTASGHAPDGSTVTDESEEGEAPVPVAGAASIPTVETWGLIAIATLLAFAALRKMM